MTHIADIDPLVRANLDVGCITLDLHPDDATFVANALRSHLIAHHEDEVIVEGAADLIDLIHEAVHALGWDPTTGQPI